MKTESSALNPYDGLFGMQGWICPKCGRVYSPFTQMCLYCRNGNSYTTDINTHTEEKRNFHVSEEDIRNNRKIE